MAEKAKSGAAYAARLATVPDGVKLDELALIGTFGTDDARRAMVRHASGRIETVKPGERVAGSKVVGISSDKIVLKSGSRTRELAMPSG